MKLTARFIDKSYRQNASKPFHDDQIDKAAMIENSTLSCLNKL